MKFIRAAMGIASTGIAALLIVVSTLSVWRWFDPYRVWTVSPQEIIKRNPEGNNFKLVDAFADMDYAKEEPLKGQVYIPIRSKSRPHDPVAAVLIDDYYTLNDFREHPELLKLSGRVSTLESPLKLPDMGLPVYTNVTALRMGKQKLPHKKEWATLVLGLSTVTLATCFWIMFVGRPLLRSRARQAVA